MYKNKILIISRPLSNYLDEGGKNLTYYLCKNSKYNIKLFCEKNCNLKLPDNIEIIQTKDSNHQVVENNKSFSIKLLIVKQILKFKSYSCIHTFFTLTKFSSILLLFARFVLRKKIVITITSVDKDLKKNYWARYILKSVTNVIVLSEYSNFLINNQTKRINIIPPTIDHNLYKIINLTRKDILKQNLKIIQYSFIIIIPGEYSRLYMNSNLIEIIKTVNQLHRNVLFIFSFRIKFTSDFAIERNVKKELENYHVLFLNTVKNYNEYAAVSDIGLFPAVNMEGKFDLPLALVELMALGKPVLHTDIPPLNELYKDKEGFCYPNNPKLLADRIIEIIESKELYNNLSKKTLREAERFLPENVIPEYNKIYEKFI